MGRRGIDSVHHKYLLGNGLIHCESCTERIRAGVSDPHEIKCSLQLAVLTKIAVQSHEDYVSGLACFYNIPPDDRRRFITPGCFNRFDIRSGGGNTRYFAGPVGVLFENVSGIAVIPQIYIEKYDIMPLTL